MVVLKLASVISFIPSFRASSSQKVLSITGTVFAIGLGVIVTETLFSRKAHASPVGKPLALYI
jgi:hypothetical protein